MTDKRINKLKRKLQEARYRLLTREPELAAPLVEMLFVTNVDVRRMSTNGSCIYFDASWLEKLDDNSLDFALCHQLMHIRLGISHARSFIKVTVFTLPAISLSTPRLSGMTSRMTSSLESARSTMRLFIPKLKAAS